jgi:hypothetical protein
MLYFYCGGKIHIHRIGDGKGSETMTNFFLPPKMNEFEMAGNTTNLPSVE